MTQNCLRFQAPFNTISVKALYEPKKKKRTMSFFPTRSTTTKNRGHFPPAASPIISEQLIQYDPQYNRAQETSHRQKTYSLPSEEVQKSRALLLIIANETTRRSISQLLQSAGYQVSVVAEVPEAWPLIATTRFALVLFHHPTPMGQHEWSAYLSLREQAGAPVMTIGGDLANELVQCPEAGGGPSITSNSNQASSNEEGERPLHDKRQEDYLTCIRMLLRSQALGQ